MAAASAFAAAEAFLAAAPMAVEAMQMRAEALTLLPRALGRRGSEGETCAARHRADRLWEPWEQRFSDACSTGVL